MNYDVPFRHQQALDPSALNTVLATLHAIGKAVEDCRNAGVSPESDPAVALLTRHMATVSANRANEDVLRAACTRRVEELKRFPTLLTLAIRGVEYDAVAKERFHEDGRRAMQMLAAALGLAVGSYEIRSFTGTIDRSGHILLAAADVAVMLRIGRPHEDREVSYRPVSGGLEQPSRVTSIRDLLKPERFAERLRRELGLPGPTVPANVAAQLAA